jgi:hypothetical protein
MNDELVCDHCGGPLDPGQWNGGICCGCAISPFANIDEPKYKQKASVCGCGFVHGSNERCGAW